MKTGKLLVATPVVLGDPNFHRAVVLMVDHKTSGSLGFILNKKLEYTLNEVMEGIDSEFPLFYGGPVDPDSLFYIHSYGSEIPKSIPISNNRFWNGDFDVITKRIRSGKLSSDKIRFFLGYSGWGEGQLEEELSQKSWEPFEVKSQTELIKRPAVTMWQECMTALGGKYVMWSNTPENPRFN